MIKIAFRLISDSCLHPLAEVFDTSSVDLPLEVFLLLTLVISIPRSWPKLLKQLTVVLVAKLCILDDLFEFGHEDVVVLALLLFTNDVNLITDEPMFSLEQIYETPRNM